VTFPEFDKLMDRYYSKMVEMRRTKGKEYANSETDRLANFKDIAKELGLTPEAVLLVYSKKHGRAIDNYCKTGTSHSEENIKGRITDRILYDFLLLGLIEDKEHEELKNNPYRSVPNERGSVGEVRQELPAVPEKTILTRI
jgi:hypothetical protein